jgi:hypothetical protein
MLVNPLNGFFSRGPQIPFEGVKLRSVKNERGTHNRDVYTFTKCDGLKGFERIVTAYHYVGANLLLLEGAVADRLRSRTAPVLVTFDKTTRVENGKLNSYPLIRVKTEQEFTPSEIRYWVDELA